MKATQQLETVPTQDPQNVPLQLNNSSCPAALFKMFDMLTVPCSLNSTLRAGRENGLHITSLLLRQGLTVWFGVV